MLILHALLAFRTGFPSYLTGFVASNMNILRREKLHDLRQHILKKRKGFLVSDTKVGILVRLSRTGQFRISGQNLF